MTTTKKESRKVRGRKTDAPQPPIEPAPADPQFVISGLTGEGAQSALDQLLAQEKKARLNKPRK